MSAAEQVAAKLRELERRENSQGTYHDVGKMNRLRNEIRRLQERIAKRQRAQD